MDEELFELCKEVYRRFGWEKVNTNYEYIDKASSYEARYGGAIFYTSDYLLEKLPRYIQDEHLELVAYGDHFEAAYSIPRTLWNTRIGSHAADTPRKALLKLVVALDDAGIKL